MTDELGSRIERPIHFECKLNEPMHIGMWFIASSCRWSQREYKKAAGESHIQVFAEEPSRDPAAPQWYSSHILQRMRVTYVTEMFPISLSLSTSRRMTDELGHLPKGHGYCPFQCPVEASCAVTFWCRLGPPRKTSYCCYGTTHSVGLDNTGKSMKTWNRSPSVLLPF